MKNQLEGTIYKVFPTEQVLETFIKREFVLVTDADTQYPQKVLMQCIQQNVNYLDAFKEGTKVRVNYNVRGKEWLDPEKNEHRYFNTLEVWNFIPIK